MPYVVAIMTFLTVLAAAAGLGLGGAARGLGQQLAGRATVQIVEANPDLRERQAAAALAELGKLSAVATAARVPNEKMRTLLEPWLGSDSLDGNLPVPVLIDVALNDNDGKTLGDVGQAVRAVAPAARLEPHAKFLAPLEGLLATLRFLAIALVILMATAMAAAVVLSARAALITHRATIDIMHLMGASDAQIAQLFQRRASLDALFGSAIGFAIGIAIVLFVGASLSAVGAALFDSGDLGLVNWIVIVLVPVGAVALAAFTARVTVLRALAKML